MERFPFPLGMEGTARAGWREVLFGLATLPLGPRSKVNPKAIINDLIKKYIFPVVNSGQVSFTGVNYSL
jgi:hypothetical protein